MKLSFHPAGGPADAPLSVDVTLPPLGTRVLTDVIANAFRTVGLGPVNVTAPVGVDVSSRTETTVAGGGSYGLLVPAVGPGAATGPEDSPVWLAPPFRPGSTRVNVGFVEVAGAAASVDLLVRDGGMPLKENLDCTAL